MFPLREIDDVSWTRIIQLFLSKMSSKTEHIVGASLASVCIFRDYAIRHAPRGEENILAYRKQERIKVRSRVTKNVGFVIGGCTTLQGGSRAA